MTNSLEVNYNITDNVFRRIKELVKNEQDPMEGLRISVEGGGCSGFKYKYELTDTINSDDIVIERFETKIIIDSLSAPLIQHAKIDFIEELGSSYFNVQNPNATTKCGCGNSFSI